MKKRKTLLGLGLLALVLVLGVGYAAISGVDLSISGTAATATEATDLKVSFNGTVTPTDATSGKVVGTATDGSLTGTITVTDLLLNETVSAVYELKNEETDVDAIVKLAESNGIVNSNTEFFQVTTSLDSNAELNVAAGSNGTAKVTVNVKLIKTPVTREEGTANITINLTADPE